MIQIKIEILVIILTTIGITLPIIVTVLRNKKEDQQKENNKENDKIDERLDKLVKASEKLDRQMVRFEGIIEQQVSSCSLMRKPMEDAIKENKEAIELLKQQINNMDKELRIKIAKYETSNSRR